MTLEDPREDVRLRKVSTGIPGVDVILGGGLPQGRTTLVCGGPGSGKTVLGMEFLVRGALEGRPGVFFSFEESVDELLTDFASFDLPVRDRIEDGSLELRHVALGGVEEAGAYDLEGLFIQIGAVLDRVGAERVVLDTLETLFSRLGDRALLRAEIGRLFRWLKDRGVTSLVTAERGGGTLTHHGLEEYVSDCVILLDHRVREELSTRRARVVKYRGGHHNTDEHPFLVTSSGISLLPIISSALDHPAPEERVPTGVEGLDAMLEGEGYFRGSSVLISGTAGAGKSSLAASFVEAASRRGERCLYFAFEESAEQIIRNMRSVGLDLVPAMDAGTLVFRARRPSQHGLEEHLLEIERLVEQVDPDVVVLDPVTNLVTVGTSTTTRAMLTRAVDLLKRSGITGVFTSLGGVDDATHMGISSLMDTWVVLFNQDVASTRQRGVYVLKSRGMAHSKDFRQLVVTGDGLEVGHALERRPGPT